MAVVVLLLGSSGGGFGGPVAEAATLSSRVAGYRMHMSVAVSSSVLSAPVRARGSGVFDLTHKAASMEMAMDVSGEPQAVQALGSADLDLDMLMYGPAVYLKLPSALVTTLPTGGRPWVKVDLSKLSHVPGLSSLAGNPTIGDPGRILQSLRSVSDSVTNDGPDRVDGERTTHYQAELSTAHLIQSLYAGGQSGQALSALGAVPALIPVDVWIDGHHLVRRVRMELDLNLPSGPSLHEAMTIDLSDYGPQTAPAPPPSDQVTDLSGLAGLAR